MPRRILPLFLALLLLVFLSPAALAADGDLPALDDPQVLIKQTRSSGTCTLASAAMMLRRAYLLRGDAGWASVTEASCRSAFWRGGLPYEFSYGDLSVGHAWLPGGAASRAVLAEVLADHPEGVVLLSRGARHGVLLTDCTDGVFYCADPAPSIPAGRIPIDQAWGTRVENSGAYWYVTTPLPPPAEPAPALPMEPLPASRTLLGAAEHLGLTEPLPPAGPVRTEPAW